jgi:hypothetical protein
LAHRWSEGRAARRSLKAQEIKGFVIDDGVQLVAADSETLFRWSSFAAFEVVGDLLILWLASGSALALSPLLFCCR